MASKRKGLGRGLDALFGDKVSNVPADAADVVREISVEKIHPNPYQPRKYFDPQTLNELAESIKLYGILQPIIVRKLDSDDYELIAGERRVRAAKIAALKKIPAVIRKYTDREIGEIALIENVQRQNLNPIEEAQAYKRLIDEFGYTQDKIAKKIGISRPQITNTIRLLKLAPQVRDLVATGKLTAGQVKPLLAFDAELQVSAAEMIVAENLTSKTVEAMMREFRQTILMSEAEVQEILAEKVSDEEKSADENLNLDDSLTADEKIFLDTDSTKPSAPKKTSNKTSNKTSAKTSSAVEEKTSAQTSTETSAKTSSAVEEKNSAPTSRAVDIEHENYVKLAENKLTELLDLPVKIVSDAKTNQIQITFSDDSQLLQIIRNLDRRISSHEVAEPEISLPSTREEKIAALRKFSVEGSL